MASFLANIGWERPRKRENKKKIVPMNSYPTRNKKFQKKTKTIQKIKKKKKNIMTSFQAKIGCERPRKR